MTSRSPVGRTADAGGHVLQYFAILRRRWFLACVVFLSVMVTFIAHTLSKPPVYSASVDVLIAPEAWGEVFLREGAGGAKRAEDFQVYIDHAKSEACLGAVIRKGVLGVPPAPRSSEWIGQFVTLENAIKASRLGTHRVVTLEVKWGNPDFCQILANELAQAYVATISEAKVRVGVVMERFLDSEVVNVQSEIGALRTLVHGLEQQTGSRSLADSIQATLSEIRASKRLLMERNAEASALREELRQASAESRALGRGPDMSRMILAVARLLVAVPEGGAGSYAEALRVSLETERDRATERVTRLAQLSRTFTSRHPDQTAASLETYRQLEDLIDRTAAWTLVAQAELDDEEREVMSSFAQAVGGAAISSSRANLSSSDIIDETALDRYRHELKIREDLLERLVARKIEIQLSRTGQEGSATWIRPAALPQQPIDPNIWQMLPLGLALALALAVCVLFLMEHLDTAVRFPELVESRLGLNVLGFVPMFRAKKSVTAGAPLESHLMLRSSPSDPSGEAYRAIARKIEAGDRRVIGLTSPGPQEGKSTSAANIATALAEVGKKTLLISANLRRPTLHNFFGTRDTPGLTEIADGTVLLEDCVIPTGIEGLDLLPSGKTVESPTVVLASKAIEKALGVLRTRYDIILVDLPPAVLVADYLVLAGRVDAFILVALVGRAREPDLGHIRDAIESVGGHILGAILNDATGEGRYQGRYGYSYSYGYRNEGA